MLVWLEDRLWCNQQDFISRRLRSTATGKSARPAFDVFCRDRYFTGLSCSASGGSARGRSSSSGSEGLCVDKCRDGSSCTSRANGTDGLCGTHRNARAAKVPAQRRGRLLLPVWMVVTDASRLHDD